MSLAQDIRDTVDRALEPPDYIILGTKEILELGLKVNFNTASGERWFHGTTILVVDLQSHLSYAYRNPP